MQDGFKDKDIEFALYVLQHADTKEDDEIRVWLEEKEHRDLLEELRCFREAGMWEAEKLDVDEDYQWQLLERRAVLRKRKRNIRRILTGVAAVVIMSVVASVYIYYRQEENLIKEISQISLNAETDVVRLITGKGEEYILVSSAPNNNDTLEKRGIVIDSVGGLKYMRILHDTTRSEEFHTLRVPRGGEYILVLDDGTRVWINSESELRYPVVFCDSVRKVYLKGEAYFKVQADADHPFIVEANGIDVVAVGTEFNVNSRKKKVVESVLVKGRVEVENEIRQVMLSPNQLAVCDVETNGIMVKEVDIRKYIDWKNGDFVFSDDRLEDVMNKLSLWYDCDVVYSDEGLKEIRLSGDMKRYSEVEEFLHFLEISTGACFNVKNKTIVVSIK